jgi:hypothetical protein
MADRRQNTVAFIAGDIANLQRSCEPRAISALEAFRGPPDG